MNRPRRRAGLRETERERAFSPSPSRFSRKREPKEENVAPHPGCVAFASSARGNPMHMAQKTDKAGTALRFSRIRERKSLSGVLTNPSFPCKMKGVPDAVRAAGGRFSACPLSPRKGGARLAAERSGEEAAMFLSAQCAASPERLSSRMRSRRGGDRASAGQAAARLSAGRKTECASYASAAQSDGMLL